MASPTSLISFSNVPFMNVLGFFVFFSFAAFSVNCEDCSGAAVYDDEEDVATTVCSFLAFFLRSSLDGAAPRASFSSSSLTSSMFLCKSWWLRLLGSATELQSSLAFADANEADWSCEDDASSLAALLLLVLRPPRQPRWRFLTAGFPDVVFVSGAAC